MKKILMLVVGVMTTITFGQNLVVNGDFETWTDATTLTSFSPSPFTAAVSQETTIKHNGNYSVKHTTPIATVAPPTNTAVKIQNETVTIIPGHTYTISFWYLDNDTNAKSRPWMYWITSATPAVTITDATTDTILRPTTYSTDSAQWTQWVATVTAPATAAKLRFEVRSYAIGTTVGSGGGVVYYDDFSVIDNSPMATNQNQILGLQVYPNPTKNILNIVTDSNSIKNVQIYDMIGKKVLTINTDNEVNVSSLTPGLYLAKITEEGKTSTRKVVIN
jgi:hypothetical protein